MGASVPGLYHVMTRRPSKRMNRRVHMTIMRHVGRSAPAEAIFSLFLSPRVYSRGKTNGFLEIANAPRRDYPDFRAFESWQRLCFRTAAVRYRKEI